MKHLQETKQKYVLGAIKDFQCCVIEYLQEASHLELPDARHFPNEIDSSYTLIIFSLFKHSRTVYSIQLFFKAVYTGIYALGYVCKIHLSTLRTAPNQTTTLSPL